MASPEAAREVVRHRVDAALAKRLAAQQSESAEQAAAQHAVALDRLAHVIRAGRMEPAMLPEQGADPALVTAQQRAGEALARVRSRAGDERVFWLERGRRLWMAEGTTSPSTPGRFPAGRVGCLLAVEFRLPHADA